VTEALDRSRRWRTMLDLLSERTRLSVGEAAAELGVSEATVRRDFTALADQQLVSRTHGGVVATSVAYDLPARYRGGQDGEARERIGAAAVDLVKAGMVVGFNGGRTTTVTARRLAARADLAAGREQPAFTVVTNALNIATEMVLRPHIRTVTLGGVARPESYELTGPLATKVLDDLWFDVLFLGVDGLSPDAGASCMHVGEAEINSLMVRRAGTVVVLAGSEKLGRRTFARICDVSAIATLITDDGADPAEVERLRGLGLDVVVA
jgi:DeoR family transcriptional regulator, aga operon transcriptional repressor